MDLVKKEKRGFAMSVKQTGVPAGGALAAAVLPPLAIHFSWQFSLVVAGLVVILSGLLSQKIYLSHGEEVSSSREGAGDASSIQRENTHQNKNIIFLGLGGAFCSLVQIALVTYLILYLRDAKDLDLMLAAFCLTLVNIGGILGRVFWGGLSDWLFKGSRKVVLKIIVSVMFLASFILGLNFALPIAPLFFVLFVFGFSAIGWNGVYHALVGEVVNKEIAGRAIGFAMTITFIGNLSGPVLFGKILDATQSYNKGWFFLCGSMVGAFIFFSLVEEKGSRW
jgi:sugar phosphate permease